MLIDVVLPQGELSGRRADVLAFAETSESLGFGRLVVYDHVLGAAHDDRPRPMVGPYDETHVFHEPLVLMGFLAAATSRIELMTGVLVAPQRQTALLAKQAAEVQVLSDNRLVLGLGTGWNYVEFEALGMPFEPRGAVLDEQIELLRRLWREPVVTTDTDHHRIDRAGLAPRPSALPPIWLGGSTRRAFERAARAGDGFIHPGRGDAIETACDDIRKAVVRAGRDPGSFPLEFFLDAAMGPEQWNSHLDRLAGLHVDRVAFRTLGAGLSDVSAHLALLEDFAQHVDAAGASESDCLAWISTE